MQESQRLIDTVVSLRGAEIFVGMSAKPAWVSERALVGALLRQIAQCGELTLVKCNVIMAYRWDYKKAYREAIAEDSQSEEICVKEHLRSEYRRYLRLSETMPNILHTNRDKEFHVLWGKMAFLYL